MNWWALFWLALYTQSICYLAFKCGKAWQRYKTETRDTVTRSDA